MICLPRSEQPASKLSTPKTPALLGSTRFPGEPKNERRAEQPEADVELDLTPGALEKTNDPVRMYLREMGTVPLLTRDGEVEIAKRIERGQLNGAEIAFALSGDRHGDHFARGSADEGSQHHQGPHPVQRRGTDRRKDRRKARGNASQ